MSTAKNVNLDAMIPREDFAIVTKSVATTDKLQNIGIRDLNENSHMRPHLRKPDFQRETNHWIPEQVVSLIQSFLDGDLIPSVIMWQSQESPKIFVIDGGHRLSALRAWIEDDYGDGAISKQYFGDIGITQKKAAENTRKLIKDRIGSYAEWKKINDSTALQSALGAVEQRRLQRFATGMIPVQWVPGDVDKAEASFFKINTKGTPLDEIEELLIRNRQKPTAICARSIIRAGMGHKYWSKFDQEKISKIEESSKELNNLLFEPEFNTPIKTLDLPLGGNAGVRSALSLLIDFILLANQNDVFSTIDGEPEDLVGDEVIKTLLKTLNLTNKMTGNSPGSLGLHPAIYFYSSAGKFSVPLFMAVAKLIAKKLKNNDNNFFKKFTGIRGQFEKLLIKHRSLIGVISNQVRSKSRYDILCTLLEFMIDELLAGKVPSTEDMIAVAKLKTAILIPKVEASDEKFSKDTKNAIFLNAAISSALICPICDGYLDANKSVSYDHKLRVREGGFSDEDNGQMTHPFCNTGYKN